MDYLSSLLPLAVASVDRLDEIPDRVRFIFAFDAGGGRRAARGRGGPRRARRA